VTPPLQADPAAEARTSPADHANPASAAALLAAQPASSTVKTVAKRVARTPAKKSVAAAKQAIQVVVKPVAKRTTLRLKAKPVMSPASTIAPKVEVKTAEQVQPKTAATAVAKQAEVKLLKPKKPKLVRDSFTMPEPEYALIAALKKRCLSAGVPAKKSEILRAAVAYLAKLSDTSVLAAVRRLDIIKTGRPAKSSK
jgi:hypothetical protein